MPHLFETDDLNRLLATIWRSLSEAVRVPGPLRTPVISTIGVDGSPQGRVVVVRSADAASRMLSCFADVRSPKIAELKKDRRIVWAFYDDASRMQIRAEAVATIHHRDDVSRSRWPAVPETNRVNYRSHEPPGTPLERYDAATIDEAVDGASNFAVIQSHVTRIDWLWLRPGGYRRARFAFDEQDGVRATWVTP